MSTHEIFLRMAISEAVAGANSGRGGPFGAVVVKDGVVIAAASNGVVALNDPTAHAEVQAIRAACAALGHFQLDGCDVYASCEPCPMCLGALYWARPRAVYYTATRQEAALAGFDDHLIYEELVRPLAERRLRVEHIALAEATAPFEAYAALAARVPY